MQFGVQVQVQVILLVATNLRAHAEFNGGGLALPSRTPTSRVATAGGVGDNASPSTPVDDRCFVVVLLDLADIAAPDIFSNLAARLERPASPIREPPANAYNCIGPCTS